MSKIRRNRYFISFGIDNNSRLTNTILSLLASIDIDKNGSLEVLKNFFIQSVKDNLKLRYSSVIEVKSEDIIWHNINLIDSYELD